MRLSLSGEETKESIIYLQEKIMRTHIDKAERWPPVNERCGQSLLNGSFQLWELKML